MLYMKIAYIAPYEGEKEIALSLLSEYEVVFVDAPIRDEVPELIRDAEVLSVFVDSKISETMVDSMPNLTHIVLLSGITSGARHFNIKKQVICIFEIKISFQC